VPRIPNSLVTLTISAKKDIVNRYILSPLIIGSTLVLVLLVSCAAPPATPTHTPTPATPTRTPIPATPTRTPLPPPISPEFPTGSFYHQHGPSIFCVFQFNEDGTWAFFRYIASVDVSNRQPYASGIYSIDGNLYTEMYLDRPDCSEPATYAWTYDGKTLAFQVVGEDKCAERQQTYETWRKYTKVE